MNEFFRNLSRKYYVFIAVVLALNLGKISTNLTIAFLSDTLWQTLFIPLAILTFWDDFFKVFPGTEAPKMKKSHMQIITVSVYFILFNLPVLYNYADIPSVLKKNYAEVSGKVSYQSIKKGLKDKQYFEIDNKIYSNSASDFIKVERDKKYKVMILKNSKFVLDIEKID